jgi:ribonucleoside-diphosphate reductase alpha chain
MTTFANALAEEIWRTRYRFEPATGAPESSIEATWTRVARALAAVEPNDRAAWERKFTDALADFRFLPGGRILAGAGTRRRVTLFNCFVMGQIDDSMDGIFGALREGALTLQQGGGIGYDFSPLRPAGAPADAAGGTASGPVSFMHVWDAMCATVQSAGARRGAMMATLRCDHPDIETFVAAKRQAGALTRFNLSVLVTDGFLHAIDAGTEWPLVFPAEGSERHMVRAVRARDLWESIVQTAYECAEPGVIFIDRVRALDNLGYAERIGATNPCGEIPLPPYGACDLGSINLTRFVTNPFTPHAQLDTAALAATARVAARMLDDVYDVSGFPLPQQGQAARASRRIGLGITGLADALIMLGLAYDDERARRTAGNAMQTVTEAAYWASVETAREKGAFPLYDTERYLAAPFIQTLPPDLIAAIERHGIRNSHLTAIAPAGTISLLAGNVSSGLEPVYALQYDRGVREPDGMIVRVPVECYALAEYVRLKGEDAPLTEAFVTMADVGPDAQLRMQAALQAHIDNAIAKTVNVPPDIPFVDFAATYRRAYALGLKGCTVYRPNPVTGAILTASPTALAASPTAERCCELPGA